MLALQQVIMNIATNMEIIHKDILTSSIIHFARKDENRISLNYRWLSA